MREKATDNSAEPRIQAAPVGAEKRFNGVIERVASIMTSVVAVLLMLFVVVAIVGVVASAWRPIVRGDFMSAAVAGVDAAFVAIILLELVHTTLSRGPISNQVQEFLVIGITAAIRSGLETAARTRTDKPRDVAVDLLITSLAALLLVVALWLVWQRLNAERLSGRSAAKKNA